MDTNKPARAPAPIPSFTETVHTDKRLVGASSPHLKSPRTTASIMTDVLIALAPAAIAGIVLMGFGALLRMIVGVAAAMLSEGVCQKLMKRPVTVKDGSAAVTGLLLAFCVPPQLPIWMLIVGSAFTIVLVKQFFGGVGHNFINPALAARGFLMASWVKEMSQFPSGIPASGDVLSGVTPLQAAAVHQSGELPYSYLQLFLGNGIPGTIGEVSKIALIIGFVYLLIRKVVSWRIPLLYLGSLFLLSCIPYPAQPLLADPVYQILSGGVILGALFMATDYASSPVTNLGQLIYGAGCGVITFFIRRYGGYPEGVTYAILFMNCAAPLIDRLTKLKAFGEVKARA